MLFTVLVRSLILQMFTFTTATVTLLTFFTIGTPQNVPLEEPCKLKDFDGIGVCVLLPSCPQALMLLKLNKIQSVRRMSCGFEGSDSKVCCPNNTEEDLIVFKNTTTLRSTTVTQEMTTSNKEARVPITNVTSPAPSVASLLPTDSSTISNHQGEKDAQAVDEETEQTPSSIPKEIINVNTSRPKSERPSPLPDRNTCGFFTATDRIFGGEIASIDEFPWSVRIKYKLRDKEVYACAGSLISDRYLITAAHCVVGNTITEVRLGEWDAETDPDCYDGICSDPVVDLKIDKIFVHPEFNRTTLSKNDIALLRLERPVNFTDFIQPICLPNTEYVARQDYVSGGSYTIAGWGSTEFESNAAVKRKLALNAVPMSTCRVVHPIITDDIATHTICAGGRKGKDSCRGDSGAGLVKVVAEDYKINWFIYGITSYGVSNCGAEGKPGLYTRITPHMDWIIEVLNHDVAT